MAQSEKRIQRLKSGYKASAAVLSFVLASAASTAALAQAATDTGQLETVVVTARYTQENLQSTPIAVTAITGSDLEKRSLTNVTDLQAAVPNLRTQPGDAGSGLTPSISMRGVAASNYNFTYEPAVGIYIDDVYHNAMIGSAMELADIGSVEVLRGPQGTLYGNASIAGTINIYSKVPKGDDTGFLDVSYGDYDHIGAKGAYDIAVIPDKLFARVSGVSQKTDGFAPILDFTCEMAALGTPEKSGTFPMQRLSSPQNGCKVGSNGGTSMNAGKVMLRYVADDRLEFNWEIAFTEENDEATPEVLMEAHPPIADNFISKYKRCHFRQIRHSVQQRHGSPPGQPYANYNEYCSVYIQGSGQSQVGGHCYPNAMTGRSVDTALKADYDITNDIHLKAILAADQYNTTFMENAIEDPFGEVQQYTFANVRQASGEVRVTGKSLDDKLDWATGLYILRAREFLGTDENYFLTVFQVNDLVQSATQSAFAHAEYHLTDALSFTGGARYTIEKKSYAFDHIGLLNIPIPISGHEYHWDWLAGVNYQVDDDLMTYAKVSTGSRPGGVFPNPVTIPELIPFQGEELTTYELGAKSEWFDHRLRANAAAYYTDYDRHLQSQTEYDCLGSDPYGAHGPPTLFTTPTPLAADCPPGGSVVWVVQSTRPATVKGGELEITAEPIDRLLIDYNLGYTHYESSIKTPGKPGFIFPGNHPPEWQMSLGAQYTVTNFLGGSLTPRLDWEFLSDAPGSISSASKPPTPQYSLPARSTLSGRISFTPDNSKWTASLSGTNLTDSYYCYNLFSGSQAQLSCNAAPPRMWMITLRRDFD